MRIVSDGRWPFELVSEGLGHHLGPVAPPGLRSPPGYEMGSKQILKFEFDDRLIFHNLMFDSATTIVNTPLTLKIKSQLFFHLIIAQINLDQNTSPLYQFFSAILFFFI